MLIYLAQIDLSGQATDLTNSALANAQAVHEAINALWDSVQQGGTYAGLCLVGANAAVLTLIFWLYNWYKSTLENGFSWEHVTHFIWPLCVMWLLISSPGNVTGEHLWGYTSAIRNFIYNANEIVLTSTSNNANLAVSRHEAGMATALDAQVKSIFTTCGSFPDPDQRKNCLDDNRDTIQSWVNGAGNTPWSNSLQRAWDSAYNAITDPYQTASSLANLYENAIVSIVKAIALAMGVAFTYLLELALLLTAMLGPISVGASLVPLPTKPILAWLTALFSIGVAQISYNIITGLMADVMVHAAPADSMAYIIFTGLLAPILALALASGSGIAVFSGLTAGAGGTVAALASLNSSVRHHRATTRATRIQQAQHTQLIDAVRRRG